MQGHRQAAGLLAQRTGSWFGRHLRADDLPVLLEEWVSTDTAAIGISVLVTLYVFIEDQASDAFQPDYGSTFPVAEAHCGLIRAIQGLLAAL